MSSLTTQRPRVNGDRRPAPLSPERRALAEQHAWIGRAVACYLARVNEMVQTALRLNRLDMDDLKQVGYLGLVVAARSWEPGGGSRFNSWVTRGASQRVLEYCQAVLFRQQEGQVGDLTLLPARPAPEPRDDVARALSMLSAKDRALLREKYGEDGTGATMREIAERCGTSPQSVTQRVQGACRRFALAYQLLR